MLEMMTIKTEAFRMTDEEFERFCFDNPDLRIERTADREIVIMSPNYTKSGMQHSLLLGALNQWNIQTKTGFCLDSSAGYTLPNGAIRMPDVSWVSRTLWNSLTEIQKERFIHACPEFLVEVKSKTDRIKDLKSKMKEWIDNGCQLAWLIDPDEEKAWIYRNDGSVEEINSFEGSLSGENVLPDFSFPLKNLRLE